ncbi:hypothetical protein SmJEL517_g02330 [Synchytrium microbalum]|uniref:Ribosomal RNA-processing protein 1 n=1 Tax=Synchytrium microbalum TaxID=1806994 RepID=A0A507CCN4_9FUNG|nr:uncharacterized protein SmJEL517_g02330 [Synchytrium microbalum]TPX35303.1 hypothetical protein SmJEL517_g02330 [Synchytrium microbalum]
MVQQEVSNFGLGTKLAHVDKKVREAAVTALKTFLKSRKTVGNMELLKLWRALFYCFWLSDKAPVQRHLAEQLASLMLDMEPEMAWRYYETFWLTMLNSWSKIDLLRLDKFYYLLRQFHMTAFKWLSQHDWDDDSVDKLLSVLADGPLHPTNMKVQDSLRYHTCEVFLEELEKALGGPKCEGIDAATFYKLIHPFITLMSKTRNPVICKYIRDGIIDPILAKRTQDDWCIDAKCQSSIHTNCSPFKPLELVRVIFQVAAHPDARSDNRTVMYELVSQMKEELGVEDLLDDVAGVNGHQDINMNGNGHTEKVLEPQVNGHDMDVDVPAVNGTSTTPTPVVNEPASNGAKADALPNGVNPVNGVKKSKKKRARDDADDASNKKAKKREAVVLEEAKALPLSPAPSETVAPVDIPAVVEEKKSINDKKKPATINTQLPAIAPIPDNQTSNPTSDAPNNQPQLDPLSATTDSMSPNTKKHVTWNKSQQVRMFLKAKPVSAIASPVSTATGPASNSPVVKGVLKKTTSMSPVVSNIVRKDGGAGAANKHKKNKKKKNKTATLANVVSLVPNATQ